jgi:hypothetical protein
MRPTRKPNSLAYFGPAFVERWFADTLTGRRVEPGRPVRPSADPSNLRPVAGSPDTFGAIPSRDANCAFADRAAYRPVAGLADQGGVVAA